MHDQDPWKSSLDLRRHDPLQLIQEGPTKLLVPPGGRRSGPGTSRQGVFFNPATAFARDLSVLYVAAVVQPGMRVLDGLTGVGARAVRWRSEVPGDYDVTANDRSPQAMAIAQRNVSHCLAHGGGDIRLLQRPLAAVLAEETFDVIDLDAPGTPAPFLDIACQSLRANGHLLITATDTMILAGPQPKICRRRYGAWPLRGELGHEVGVRILVGAVVRTAARYSMVASPSLSYVHGHWYGVYVQVTKDETRADAALEQLGYVVFCSACWERSVISSDIQPTQCVHCGEAVRTAGPLWTGTLWDSTLLQRMLADERPLAVQKDVRSALKGWLQEADGPPLLYDIHAAAAHLGRGARVLRLETLQQQLAARGFRSVRTHFAKVGIKTDAGARLVLELARNG